MLTAAVSTHQQHFDSAKLTRGLVFSPRLQPRLLLRKSGYVIERPITAHAA